MSIAAILSSSSFAVALLLLKLAALAGLLVWAVARLLPSRADPTPRSPNREGTGAGRAVFPGAWHSCALVCGSPHLGN